MDPKRQRVLTLSSSYAHRHPTHYWNWSHSFLSPICHCFTRGPVLSDGIQSRQVDGNERSCACMAGWNRLSQNWCELFSVCCPSNRRSKAGIPSEPMVPKPQTSGLTHLGCLVKKIISLKLEQ